MKLIDIANSGNAIPFVNISSFNDLVVELQTLLANNGLLDSQADGDYGPASKWALGEAAEALGQVDKTAIDADFARKLLDTASTPLFPIKPTADFAGKIVAHMKARNHWISRHPKCVNIVYVEGSKLDGTPNDNAPNAFNDVRMILQIDRDTGEPKITGRWDATTEPGKHYTENPMPGVAGAARIAFGQFKSWAVGTHPGSNGGHEALVQVAKVTVFRDANRDYKRAGDLPDTGMFGINQHWGFNMSPNNVHNASAGCLVGRTTDGHVEFMKLVKSDSRYAQSHAYRFQTTIIDRKELN